MRNFFASIALTFFTLIFFPWPVLAGSCECLDINITDTSAQIRTCSFSSGANSQQDCSLHNNTTVSGSKLSECIYYKNNNCTGDSAVSGLFFQDITCTTDAECAKKASNQGTSICINNKCWFDRKALEIYQNSTYSGQTVNFTKPKLSISIPGVNFTDAKVDNDGFVNIPFLAEYFVSGYKFAVTVASLLAVIVIILNGFRISMSGGGEEKNTGIQNITKAITGLFIIWSSYALLYTINPNLVQFNILRVKIIKPIDIPPETTDIPTDNIATAAAPTNLTPINETTDILVAGTQQARSDVVAAFLKAVEESKIKVKVSSSYRPASYQYTLMKLNCGCPDESTLPPNVAASDWKTTCTSCGGGCIASCTISRNNGVFEGPNISHFAGNAIDVSSTGEGSRISCDTPDKNVNLSQGVVLTSGANADKTCIPQQQQTFIKAMLNNNFCVGLSASSLSLRESWHFEYKNSGLKTSGFCTDNISDANLQKLYYVQN